MKPGPKPSKQPLAVTAYQTIVKKIICLEYQPSQHLEETLLVEELGLAEHLSGRHWSGCRAKKWWNPIPTGG